MYSVQAAAMLVPPSSSDSSLPATRAALPARTRCRSFCFLEHNGEPWTAFLVTYAVRDGYWRGHFMFRSALMAPDSNEVRTADLFVETSEEAVDARARSLGRPLLESLLQSAVHTSQRRQGVTHSYAKWFRELLSRSAQQHAEDAVRDPTRSLQRMKSLYESYRTDQVCHLIALTDPADFRALVEKLLDGREIDFRARDRFQLAMIVVQEIEKRLPLPTFEVWVEDYLAHPEIYEAYSEAVHSGELP
ncbi:MAG TPA: hypothetical protein VFZ04_13310 [Longimicrobiales bacterium]